MIKEECMRDDRSDQPELQQSADLDVTCEQPDLGPLRALAGREEFADAIACLTNSLDWRLCVDDPRAALARDLPQALTEAGFSLHQCAQRHPLYRLGGVCLLPVGGDHAPGAEPGIVVSWTTHNLLSLDWARGCEHRGVQDAMNRALAEVLAALGYEVGSFGTGGATIVTGRLADDDRAEQ
jgi:hypothetical protein